MTVTVGDALPAAEEAGPRQLDLFVDGREALLIHEVVMAVLARDVGRAATGLRRLRQEHPDHAELAGLAALVDALTPWPPGLVTHAGLTERIESTEQTLVPLARRLLGTAAAAFLRPRWKALATMAAHVSFDPAHPRAHRGWLCQKLDEWAEVRAAVEAEPNWAVIPLLCYWFGLAQHHLGAPEAAIRLWLPLCWKDPLFFAQSASTLPNLTLRAGWVAFEEAPLFEQSPAPTVPVAWFPPWLLVRHRGLAQLFRADEIPDAGNATRVFRHLLTIIPLERYGLSDELVRQRRALQQLAPDFFRYYLDSVGQRLPTI